MSWWPSLSQTVSVELSSSATWSRTSLKRLRRPRSTLSSTLPSNLAKQSTRAHGMRPKWPKLKTWSAGLRLCWPQNWPRLTGSPDGTQLVHTRKERSISSAAYRKPLLRLLGPTLAWKALEIRILCKSSTWPVTNSKLLPPLTRLETAMAPLRWMVKFTLLEALMALVEW